MESTPRKALGRPKKFAEPMVSMVLLVPRDIDADARKLSRKQAVSIGEVYREWIAKGRSRK